MGYQPLEFVELKGLWPWLLLDVRLAWGANGIGLKTLKNSWVCQPLEFVALKGLWPKLHTLRPGSADIICCIEGAVAKGQSCTPKVVPGAAPAWLRLRPGSADIYIYYEFTYISYIDIHMYVYVLFIYILCT